MKKKIIISLSALFIFFTLGAAIAVLYITDAISELNRIIDMHQIEQLRRSLVIDLQTVQSDLYAVNTPLANNTASITKHVTSLERSAKKCAFCHHPPELTKRIDILRYQIKEYDESINYFIASSTDPERLQSLKTDAVAKGDKLLVETQKMSHSATATLNKEKMRAMTKISRVKTILFVTVAVTFLLGVLVAVRLTKSIARPVSELIKATRMISSGKYGSVIPQEDKTEFGELAGHFNAMSIAVKEGYEKIREEIKERLQAEERLIKSEKFLGTIFESIRDPFCIFDRNYIIVRANKAYAVMMGISINEIEGKRCFKLLQDQGNVCEDCTMEKSFSSATPYTSEKSGILRDGRKAWFEVHTYPIFDEDGQVSHVIEYTRDITGRKLAEEALKESEERYVLATRGANDGLWDWDIKSNTIYYSPRWKSMLGYDEEEITNSPDEWLRRIHPEDRVRIEGAISAHIDGDTPSFKCECRIMHKDGSYRWMLGRGLAIRNDSRRAYRFAGSMTDITERKQAEEQLLFDALHDSLTNLPNRGLFMDRLEHAINREKRQNEYMFAVLFLDMDRFKVLNDSLGHTSGDQLLVAVSQRLQESLRPGDTVARFGGDEFAILLENLEDKGEALAIVHRIQEKLSKSFNLSGQEVFTSVSIGIAFSSTGYDQTEHLLRNADIAMYQAKSNGNSCYEVFDAEMYAKAVTRLRLETDLRQAVRQNEFVLHYQPIVSTRSGTIIGLEALVRWQHPSRGLIDPSEFVTVAEETGLIIDLGEWVLQEACQQLKRWHTQFPSSSHLTMSVNISSKQLLPNLVDRIERLLEETGFEPNRLILEITESMIMENAELVSPLLLKLKELDVKLYIDDFGTGYSSLSYLHHLPVDMLKIDRSFVMRVGDNGENMEIVRAIATLAHSLDMDVIAEGVETEKQMEQLKALKCEYVQGYFFSKPLESRGITDLLRKGRFDLKTMMSHSSSL